MEEKYEVLQQCPSCILWDLRMWFGDGKFPNIQAV